METKEIDWVWLEKYLEHIARNQKCARSVRITLQIISRVCEVSGEFTSRKRVLRSLGKHILCQAQLHVLVPVCLLRSDLTTGSIPTLIHDHIMYLCKIESIIKIKVDFLLPTHDYRIISDNETHLRERMEFLVSSVVSPYGYGLYHMDCVIKELVKAEKEAETRVKGCKSSHNTRTSAQYIVLGDYVASNSAVILNHSTVNLDNYLISKAAVLHNPVLFATK